MHRPRFTIGPSVGERAIAHSTRLKLDIWHTTDDDGDNPESCASFELHGCIDLTGDNEADGVDLVAALLHEFRTAERDRGKGGCNV